MCRSCGAGYVFPSPSPEEQREIAERAAQERLPREQRGDVLSRIGEHNREILESLEGRGCGGSLLDIGCGRGILMADARQRGWRVRGIEPARCTAEEGIRTRGLDITIGSLDEASLEESSFDAVVFSHSLEHMLDPCGAVCSAARLLKEGGWVYVETPNWSSLARRALGWRWWVVDLDNHLFYFSPDALRLLSRRACLRTDAIRGVHRDAFALLIRMWHFRRPEYSNLALINECRDRLLDTRGMWRLSTLLDRLLEKLYSGTLLNDYLASWMQKPHGNGR
jgi:SAM-dependent methyltransferase